MTGIKQGGMLRSRLAAFQSDSRSGPQSRGAGRTRQGTDPGETAEVAWSPAPQKPPRPGRSFHPGWEAGSRRGTYLPGAPPPSHRQRPRGPLRASRAAPRPPGWAAAPAAATGRPPGPAPRWPPPPSGSSAPGCKARPQRRPRVRPPARLPPTPGTHLLHPGPAASSFSPAPPAGPSSAPTGRARPTHHTPVPRTPDSDGPSASPGGRFRSAGQAAPGGSSGPGRPPPPAGDRPTPGDSMPAERCERGGGGRARNGERGGAGRCSPPRFRRAAG